MEEEKRMKSKLFIFFEWIYRLLVMNVLIIVPFMPLIAILRFINNPNQVLVIILLVIALLLLFPSLLATYATIKEGLGATNLFKIYFINYKTFFWKSFFIGLIFNLACGIVLFAGMFYIFQDFNQFTSINSFFDVIGEKATPYGIVIEALALVIILLMIVNIPLIMINFKKLTIKEIIRASFYLAIRYFLTTFILFILLVISFGSGILAFLSQRAAILLLWMMIGMTLPIYLAVMITRPIYFILERKQFERIMHYDKEDDLDDIE